MNRPVPIAPPRPIMMSCGRLSSLWRPASRLAIADASNRSLACGDIFKLIHSLACAKLVPMQRACPGDRSHWIAHNHACRRMSFEWLLWVGLTSCARRPKIQAPLNTLVAPASDIDRLVTRQQPVKITKPKRPDCAPTSSQTAAAAALFAEDLTDCRKRRGCWR